jgi:cyclase
MLNKRIIPCLLMKGEGLYKTTQFNHAVYLGDAVNVARIFNDKFVDELVILDIEASKTNKEPDFGLIQEITSSCFMPVAYGGGVKSMEHAKKLFALGVEKIILNTATFKVAVLIPDLVKEFGSQSIVASLNVQKNWLGKYVVVDNDLKSSIKPNLEEAVKEVSRLGVGELMITDVDNEGTMKGFDLDLFQKAASYTKVPVIASGGAGNQAHLKELFSKTDVSAVGVGSLFVFNGPRKAVLISYPSPAELKSLIR